MAWILSIETATDACSVSVSNGEQEISHEHISGGMRHSAALTSLINKALATAELKTSGLDAVAISDGPGSYTGLRVGASTAKAICYAHDLPLITISTLESIAYSCTTNDRTVMATLDARRMEVYASIYENSKEIAPTQSIIWEEDYIAELAQRFPQLTIIGTGVNKAIELFADYEAVSLYEIECSASHLIKLAYRDYQEKRFADIAYHSPYYFKSPNITTSKKKL